MLNLSKAAATPRAASKRDCHCHGEPAAAGGERELVVSSAEKAPSLRALDYAHQLIEQDREAGAIITAALIRRDAPAPRAAAAPPAAPVNQSYMPIPRGMWDPEPAQARYAQPLPQTDPSSWQPPPVRPRADAGFAPVPRELDWAKVRQGGLR